MGAWLGKGGDSGAASSKLKPYVETTYSDSNLLLQQVRGLEKSRDKLEKSLDKCVAPWALWGPTECRSVWGAWHAPVTCSTRGHPSLGVGRAMCAPQCHLVYISLTAA